ncbi:hypothetical protein BH23PLA1_BH23PLA1_00130 [soil metagenome]
MTTLPRPANEPSDSTEGPRAGRSVRTLVPAIVVAALAWAYGPDLMALVETWSEDPDYSHGFLVVPVALVILWMRWPGPGEVRLSPCRWGWGLLVVSLVAHAIFYDLGKFWLMTATLLPVLAALALSYGGWPLLQRAWPAIAFLIFMLPMPVALENRLSLPLQRLAAQGSSVLLQGSGMWVMNEGNVLTIGSEQLEVAAACNGLAMLMSLAAVVSATVLLVPMATWKRAVLLAGIIPIALLCNVLRIAATALLYQYVSTETGRTMIHDWAGWMMMPTALALVGLGLWWLSWLVREEQVVTLSPVHSALTRRPTAPAMTKPKPPGEARDL